MKVRNRRVSLVLVALMGGCAPNCAAGPRVQPATDAAATEAPAMTGAAAPTGVATKCGIEGKWCTFDVAAPDAGFAPVESLALGKALWGVDAPNLLKSLSVVWDGATQRLYAIGIATDRLVVIDPAVGRPTGVIDLDVKLHHSGILRVDEARRRVWRVDKGDGSMRVVDIDKGEVIARSQGTKMARTGEGRGYPIHDAEIDPATGWMWVANLDGHTLTGYSPDLQQTKIATGISAPASLDARNDELLVVDAPSPQAMRVLRYKPSTDTVVSESAVPRAAGPTNASYAPDGTIVLGGRVLAALGANGEPTWTRPLDGMSEAVVFTKDTVAVLMGDATDHGGGKAARGARPDGGGREARGEGRGGRGGGEGRGRKGIPPGERPPLDENGEPIGESAATESAATAGAGAAGAAGAAESETAERQLLLFDLATGAPKGSVPVRFEAKSAAVDVANGRVFVANGGDGSVTVVDAAGAKVLSTLDVGAAAEHVLVDPVSGDRYIVDRLGGSQIYRWAKGADTVEAWDGGRWPSDAVLDGPRRRLFALGHYDAELLAWDLDRKAPLAPIALGVPKNRSDTLGDLDYDGAVGIAAAVFPESGGLAVVDTVAGKVLWSRTEATLAAGAKAGPGNSFVAVDGKRDRLYVVAGKGTRVLSFGLRDGAPKGELALGESAGAEKLYNINGTWLDRAGGRLFVGPRIVRVPTLVEEGRLEGVGKVFWSDAQAILGITPGQGGQPERLVELDARTGALRTSWPLVATSMMRLNPSYDAASRRVYVADMAEARVLAWEWPRK